MSEALRNISPDRRRGGVWKTIFRTLTVSLVVVSVGFALGFVAGRTLL